MTATPHDEDPDPAEQDPAPAGLLYVPVRPGPAGLAARMFRTPLGPRTAVAFTSAHRLTATLGTGQPWIRLAEPALRRLTAPLGVARLTVDPTLCAPAPAPTPPSPPRAAPLKDPAAVTATAAPVG
ncbi:SAV_915 family protein [Streptomyces griseoviridis]|uniref:SseB protein N-terminal domain-containing protein n=1 Tax=Streptomyces griseoviridis TaxID=45398 RepID=A0A3Q9KP92_STRGD|nr:SAV_915 family protein [Streptomyces griseoviridis]AZS86060.1 hypothetical protein ELQ87_18595 [Streptomyces griseoviridis]QCN87080.1 hypothetical protein DDJ31_20690 [Streptomyces griseoviridis]